MIGSLFQTKETHDWVLDSNKRPMIGTLVQTRDPWLGHWFNGSLVRTRNHNWVLGSDQGLPIALNLSYTYCLWEILSEQGLRIQLHPMLVNLRPKKHLWINHYVPTKRGVGWGGGGFTCTPGGLATLPTTVFWKWCFLHVLDLGPSNWHFLAVGHLTKLLLELIFFLLLDKNKPVLLIMGFLSFQS